MDPLLLTARRRPRDREKGSGVRREAPQGLQSSSLRQILPRPRRGVPPKPLPGAKEAQGGGGEPLPQARAFPGDGEGPPSAFPSLCLSGLAREPVEGDRRKELPRRPSLAGPEGRPLPSSPRARGAEGSFPPQAHPFGIVGEVAGKPRLPSWWGVGAQKCALWLTRTRCPGESPLSPARMAAKALAQNRMVTRAAASALGSMGQDQVVEAPLQEAPFQEGVHLFRGDAEHPGLHLLQGEVAAGVEVLHP